MERGGLCREFRRATELGARVDRETQFAGRRTDSGYWLRRRQRDGGNGESGSPRLCRRHGCLGGNDRICAEKFPEKETSEPAIQNLRCPENQQKHFPGD